MIVSTLALAGSAAYYSVFGLSSLFAGARFEVIIMAGALEFSKLIIASYLHNHWSKAGWMKWYLTLAVGVLMIITSAGIYGFLTSAYQKTADQLGVMEKQINVIELKKDRFQEQLDYYNTEKVSLSNSIADLRNGITNNKIQYKDTLGNIITTQSSSTRKLLSKELDLAVQSRSDVSVKIETVTDSITKLDLQILDLESNNEVAAEIGPLRYMAEITNKPMNVIVNWFTLLIVFVFDPLAIAMVIALNKLIGRHERDNNNSDSSDIFDNNEDIPTPTNVEDVEDVSVSRNEVDEERSETAEEEVETVEEATKEEVKFIPTDEDAKELYGEIPIEKPKHTYADIQKKI
tara:strand:+ start:134 stop:1174 length:1041 start_codon:yes stop_codon:yes gene_type:complete